MIHIEQIEIKGKMYKYVYSDQFLIERDGICYVDAIDPIDSNREYLETRIPLPERDLTPEEALKIIVGG